MKVINSITGMLNRQIVLTGVSIKNIYKTVKIITIFAILILYIIYGCVSSCYASEVFKMNVKVGHRTFSVYVQEVVITNKKCVTHDLVNKTDTEGINVGKVDEIHKNDVNFDNVSKTDENYFNRNDVNNTDSGNVNDIYSDIIDKNDYKNIDETVRDETGLDISFETIVNTLSDNNGYMRFKDVVPYISKIILSGRNNIIQILILCIFSALINLLTPVFNEKQLKDTAAGVVSVSLVTILMAVFLEMFNVAQNTIASLINIYKVISMVFFPAMCASGFAISAAGYYQIVIWMMTVADIVIKNILMNGVRIYACITLCDCIEQEAHFGRMCAFIQKGIKWGGYLIITFFMGLNGIKSIIGPLKDNINTSYVYKAVSIIPGIGDAASVLSQTVIASSALIRNTIGAAGVITLVICMAFPVIKLVVVSCIYHGVAAVIEPIADKRITRAVSGLACAVGSLTYLVVISSILFIITIMLICIVSGH